MNLSVESPHITIQKTLSEFEWEGDHLLIFLFF